MSKTVYRGSRPVAFILAMLFTLCAISLSASLTLKHTLLSERYFTSEIGQANIPGQISSDLMEEYGSAISKLGLSSQEIEDEIVKPISDEAVRLVTAALYDSDQLSTIEESAQANLNQAVMDALNEWSPTAASLTQSVVNNAVNSLIGAIHSKLKLDQLQTIGNTLDSLQDISTILLYISAVLGIICLIYLLLAASPTTVFVPLFISGLLMGAAALAANFLQIIPTENTAEIIANFLVQYQSHIASQLGVVALLNGAAALIFGAVSLIIRKIKH